MSRRLKVLTKLALTIAILGATLWFVKIDRVVGAIRQLDVRTWLVTLAVCLLVHALGAFKWRFFMSLTGARIGLRDGFRCYAAGLFANLFLPTMIGGDVLRAGLAMAATRQKTAVVLGSLLDRFADLVGLGVLALAGFLVAWRPSSEVHASTGSPPWVPWVVGVALAIAAAIAVRVLWKRWHPKGRARKLILETFVALRRLRSRIPLAILGLVVSTTLQLVLLLIHRELGLGIGMRGDLAMWLFVWPLSKLVAMLPISLSGLGVREAAFMALAKPFGVPEPVAVATSLAWQSIMLLSSLAGGAVWVGLTWRPQRTIQRPERQPT